MPRHSRRVLALLATALVAFALVVAAAQAGTYTVTGTCGNWAPFNAPSGIAVYAACPTLIARNVGGAFSTLAGAAGGWIFRAPSGTSIYQIQLYGTFKGGDQWHAAGALWGGPFSGWNFEDCPSESTNCLYGQKTVNGEAYPGTGATAALLFVQCRARTSCPNNVNWDTYTEISQTAITLTDYLPPSATPVGGTLMSGRWLHGSETVAIAGNDNTGVRYVHALIDGNVVASAGRSCNYSVVVPCPNGATAVVVQTAGLVDGIHRLSVSATDAAGNTSVGNRVLPIDVDNTPPSQPLAVALAGGPGWRSSDDFSVTWDNPPQAFAPIVGANYRLCPEVPANSTAALRGRLAARCVSGQVHGTNVDAIRNLRVPDLGAWHLDVWLVDAAGNQQPASAVGVGGLEYDNTPPAGLAFQRPSPEDPARVRVSAVDPTSGLVSGVVEVQRVGDQVWRPLATQVTPQGLTSFIDDETLRRGTYLLRARAVNGAGLEASTDRMASGQAAVVTLPIRAGSALSAGERVHHHCGRGSHRRACVALIRRPSVGLGRPPRLAGRLFVSGKPMARAPIEVWRRLDLARAPWVRVATLTTARSGQFAYRPRSGPAQTIRFRYPGTNTIRGHNTDVGLRVRAASTLRPSRRLVINGEYVTFRGRLKGGWIPAGGVLVQLQVYTRGQWRTFAQPRARADGRWSYQYRFETVRGRADFQFRARIPQQYGYPFAAGSSRTASVQVRGL